MVCTDVLCKYWRVAAMNVLKILQNNGKDLLPSEIELLHTQLATGDYTEDYKKQCKSMLIELENWAKEATKSPKKKRKEIPTPVRHPDAILPTAPDSPPERQVEIALQKMRTEKDYKAQFKHYVNSTNFIDEDFLQKNFSLFREHEMDVLLSCIKLSEAFLEKHFSLLNPKMIALHQKFSENFFMKHFEELPVETTLTRGVNSWKEMSARSTQLSVFLRIKGVQL